VRCHVQNLCNLCRLSSWYLIYRFLTFWLGRIIGSWLLRFIDHFSPCCSGWLF
jgi:hypothetical protein